MLSVVIPIYNEQELINELVSRVSDTLNGIGEDYEIIFVDDGSIDGSVDELLEKQKSNKSIKIVSLSRNFGHQAALTAGLEYAKGDFIAILDGDLQDPPELMVEMYDALSSNGNIMFPGA